MTGRLKLIAAALGLVLATGTVADVSAQTNTTPASTTITRTDTAKPVTVKAGHRLALKTHRLHVAHLRHGHKVHLAHRKIGAHVVKAGGVKTGIKQVDTLTLKRERHAMNQSATKKPASVIR